MEIPQEVWRAFIENTRDRADVDTLAVMQLFDEPEGSRILEVGAHDEPLANVLADLGFRVTGVDLREYDPDSPPVNYEYFRADFCDLPINTYLCWYGAFDSVVLISAVEHFGLGTYGEGPPNFAYDVIAMRTVWQVLKPGGSCYLTVPMGAKHTICHPHWRVYDPFTLNERLVQDFAIEGMVCATSGPGVEIDGEKYGVGQIVPYEKAKLYAGDDPHVSVILKLRKPSLKRVAPDGR